VACWLREDLGFGFLAFSPLGADFLTGTTDTTTRFEPLAPKVALRWIAKLATAGERIGASGESTIVDQVISFLARTLASGCGAALGGTRRLFDGSGSWPAGPNGEQAKKPTGNRSYGTIPNFRKSTR
jgi:hypothetical protein